MPRLLPSAQFELPDDWPPLVKWLLDRPLQVVIIVLVAVIVVLVCHHLIKLLAGRIEQAKLPGSADQPYAQARRATRAQTARSVLNSVTTVAVWVIAIVLILERLGVNVAVLVTSLGVAGVGLGLGAQSLIKDWIAGLFMILEDQFGIGDTIDIGPTQGRVVNLSLRITTIQADNGTLWYVPNGTVTRIANQSQGRQGAVD